MRGGWEALQPMLQQPRRRRSWPALVLMAVCALALLASLSGCGGGGEDEPEARAGVQPLNCHQTPQVCQ